MLYARPTLNVWLLMTLIVLYCLSCSSSGEDKEPAVSSEFRAGQYRIEFSLPGDDFASIEELKKISRIKNRIIGRMAGEDIHIGSGMGTLTLLLTIHSRKSLGIIEKIIREEYPGARYFIAPDRNESGDLDLRENSSFINLYDHSLLKHDGHAIGLVGNLNDSFGLFDQCLRLASAEYYQLRAVAGLPVVAV
jgi:hypothetical protein